MVNVITRPLHRDPNPEWYTEHCSHICTEREHTTRCQMERGVFDPDVVPDSSLLSTISFRVKMELITHRIETSDENMYWGFSALRDAWVEDTSDDGPEKDQCVRVVNDEIARLATLLTPDQLDPDK